MRAAGLEPLEPYPTGAVPWRCRCVKCEREVTPTYENVKNGKRCAYCAGVRVDATDAGELMRAAGLEPLEPYPGTNVPWRCRCLVCNHEVTPQYTYVRQGKGGCLTCSRKRMRQERLLPESETVATMVAAGLEPLEPYPGIDVPWRSRCTQCEREVAPHYSTVRAGGGCAYCSRTRVDPNDAVATMAAAGLEPLEPYPGDGKPWRCRCTTCSREVTPTHSAVRGGGGCAYCSRTRVDATEAGELMRAAGLEPLEPYPGNGKPWRSRCTQCEREVAPHYSTVRAGGGCAYCSRTRVDPDDAVATMRAAGLEPLEPFPGAQLPWRCRCLRCEQTVTPRLNGIQSGQGGCMFCAGKVVDVDEALALMVTAGFEPLEPYPGSGVPWRSRCTQCEREVTPTYGTVRNGGSCRFCAKRGLDYAAPGIVYLMHHPDLFCLKVGVTTATAKEVRVNTHARTGWVIVQTWDTPTGDDAERVEQQVLDWWRNELGAPAALTKAEMPTGGHTETAALIHVDIDWTIDRVNWLVSQLDGE